LIAFLTIELPEVLDVIPFEDGIWVYLRVELCSLVLRAYLANDWTRLERSCSANESAIKLRMKSLKA
jgi:hypothetical protein